MCVRVCVRACVRACVRVCVNTSSCCIGGPLCLVAFCHTLSFSFFYYHRHTVNVPLFHAEWVGYNKLYCMLINTVIV